MNFTINKINNDGSVDVTFSDNKKQNISGLPVTDEIALTNALIAYGQAYESGVASEAVTVDTTEVKALEGKKVDVQVFLDEQEAIRVAELEEAEAKRLAEEAQALLDSQVVEVVETPVVEVPVDSPTVPEEMITPEMAEAGVTTETPLMTRDEVVAQLGEEKVAELETLAGEVEVVTPVEAVADEVATDVVAEEASTTEVTQ